MEPYAPRVREAYDLVNGVLCSVAVSAGRCPVDLSFPPGFRLGVASSAYQVEGAWNVSDKGPSMWDAFTHKLDMVKDRSTGDVACDSYHLWSRDVQMVAEMGVGYYRISMSWPRLLPKGYDYYISQDGVRYYNDLINGLIARGVEPVVTLHHWDLPEIFQELGGWTNPLIANWFAEYARIVYSHFGDRVKTWLTINEPLMLCDFTYVSGKLAPGFVESYEAPFICTKNVMLAHAKAWRIYEEEFKPFYHGRVSIANHYGWYQPKSLADGQLAELVMQYVDGRYSHPIYSKTGGWPPSLVQAMLADSVRMGYPRSRLPDFTEEEKNFIRGTFDFMAFNYYISRTVRPARVGEHIEPSLLTGIPELGAVLESPTNNTSSDIAFYSQGLRKLLNWLKATYGHYEMFITENGFPSGIDLDDRERINFIRSHLKQVLLAIKLDHVAVTGYTYWSIMDNFEWTNGYTAKFGLYSVNFTDPLRTRTARSSARYYSDLSRQRRLDIRT